MRPIEARISATALRHNYGVARAAAPGARVMAVVKANAYGHGLDRVARALGGAHGFATIELDGAVRLRAARPDASVVLLEGFFEPRELREIATAGLATAVHDEEQLRMLEAEALPAAIDVWLKVNTGMNRLGFAPERARAALERLEASGRVRSVTWMTHFANSDGPPGIDEAMRRFEGVVAGSSLPRSLANTAAIFAHPRTHANAVRLGIGLYGATPFADRSAASLGLRAAMSFTSKLIAVQDLAAGESVGYGSRWTATKPTRIGVVACGYADGYPRHAPSGTPMLVDGVRTGTVGRVSMDMITVDLTPVPGAGVGSTVELWGEALPVDDVATAAGTVGYELLCAVASRVPVVEAP